VSSRRFRARGNGRYKEGHDKPRIDVISVARRKNELQPHAAYAPQHSEYRALDVGLNLAHVPRMNCLYCGVETGTGGSHTSTPACLAALSRERDRLKREVLQRGLTSMAAGAAVTERKRPEHPAQDDPRRRV
jgi:hypothetical protein